jgi:flagellar hook-length control protein FliK
MQVTPPAPQAAAPAQSSAHKPAEAAPAPFAKLLLQSQSAQQAAPAEAARPEPEPDTPAQTDAPAAPETPLKPRLKPADKASAQRSGPSNSRDATKTEAAATEPAERSQTQRSAAPLAEPTLAPWLLALQHLVEPPVPAGTQAGSDTDTPARAEPVPFAETTNPAAANDKNTMDAKVRTEHSAAPPTNPAPWAAAGSAEPGALSRASEDLRNARPLASDAPPSAAALGAAAFNPLLAGARESAAPQAVNLPTPLASPEFAQALAVQMSVLATDGVQHAELHLNPAEMGPVSVRIVLDGTRAQVDFGADLAATRQAIEAGLPELAGALRDAGFTLSGGGVSQHSGNRGGSQESGRGHGGGERGAVDAGAVTATAARSRRSVSAGGVDLYA